MTTTVTAAATPDPLEEIDPAFTREFDGLYDRVWGDGAVSAKQKQLAGIAMGLMVKCEPCAKYHLREAKRLGATREEVVEILRISLIAGGSAGIPTMRGVAAQLLELEKTVR